MGVQDLVSKVGVSILVGGLSWALWHVFVFVVAWLKIKRNLDRSKIPVGPSLRESLTILGIDDPHRTILGWVEKYGGIFYTHLLHFHVSPSSLANTIPLPSIENEGFRILVVSFSGCYLIYRTYLQNKCLGTQVLNHIHVC
jgi:hypothetical protein